MEEHELELGEKPRPSYRKKSGPKPKQSDDKLSYTVGFSVSKKEQEQLRAEHEIASAQSKITFANFLKEKVMQTKSSRKTRKRNESLNQSDRESLTAILIDLGVIRKHLKACSENLEKLSKHRTEINSDASESTQILRDKLEYQYAKLNALIPKVAAWYQD
ncbi:hypothetical protein [Rudanella lutea]|uniref:hypothetical protein n=1 Tax=Rudanella lutea TaxID=451374 RepID=UPI000372E487|nr:hypothetical protein [Rudanella lutea]